MRSFIGATRQTTALDALDAPGSMRTLVRGDGARRVDLRDDARRALDGAALARLFRDARVEASARRSTAALAVTGSIPRASARATTASGRRATYS